MFRENEHPRDESGKFTDKGAGAGDAEKLRKAVRIYSDEPEKDAPVFVDDEDWKNGHVLETVPREKRAKYIQDELGVSFQDAEKYSEALYYYTDDFNNVKDIRAYQRGETIKNAPEVAKQEQALEGYIARAPKWSGGETFRGVKLSEKELSQYVAGSEHDMLGTSSWSSDEDTAIGYAGYGNPPSGKRSAVFHSSTQTNGTSVRHLSPFANEDEVLVSKRSKYRVLKVIKSQDGISHIYLEEI